jgi:hypothetical protein
MRVFLMVIDKRFVQSFRESLLTEEIVVDVVQLRVVMVELQEHPVYKVPARLPAEGVKGM